MTVNQLIEEERKNKGHFRLIVAVRCVQRAVRVYLMAVPLQRVSSENDASMRKIDLWRCAGVCRLGLVA